MTAALTRFASHGAVLLVLMVTGIIFGAGLLFLPQAPFFIFLDKALSALGIVCYANVLFRRILESFFTATNLHVNTNVFAFVQVAIMLFWLILRATLHESVSCLKHIQRFTFSYSEFIWRCVLSFWRDEVMCVPRADTALCRMLLMFEMLCHLLKRFARILVLEVTTVCYYGLIVWWLAEEPVVYLATHAVRSASQCYVKHERVIYMTRDRREVSAIVVGVHQDHGPEPGYTVVFPDEPDTPERQTVASRLRKCGAAEADEAPYDAQPQVNFALVFLSVEEYFDSLVQQASLGASRCVCMAERYVVHVGTSWPDLFLILMIRKELRTLAVIFGADVLFDETPFFMVAAYVWLTTVATISHDADRDPVESEVIGFAFVHFTACSMYLGFFFRAALDVVAGTYCYAKRCCARVKSRVVRGVRYMIDILRYMMTVATEFCSVRMNSSFFYFSSTSPIFFVRVAY